MGRFVSLFPSCMSPTFQEAQRGVLLLLEQDKPCSVWYCCCFPRMYCTAYYAAYYGGAGVPIPWARGAPDIPWNPD
jgi:hypothetical protein